MVGRRARPPGQYRTDRQGRRRAQERQRRNPHGWRRPLLARRARPRECGGRNHQAVGEAVTKPACQGFPGDFRAARFHFARLWRRGPQLQALFLRPKRLADWHLDDAPRHQLAGLSTSHSALLLGVVSFAGQIVSAGAAGGRLGGAPESPQAAGVDASRRRRPVHALVLHQLDAITLGNYRARRPAGLDQCVRHGRQSLLMQMVEDPNDQQRHRHQRLDGQWRAPDRPGHRRFGDRRRRRRLVLPDRWRTRDPHPSC